MSSVSTDLLGGHVGRLPKMATGCMLRILIVVRAFTTSSPDKDARHDAAVLQPAEPIGGRTCSLSVVALVF
jgi:hypothetical protein